MFSRKKMLLLTILFWCVKCQISTVKHQVQLYEQNVKTSIDLERQERVLVNSWTEQFQIKQVNVTSSFRLQMMKHKERCFRKNNNKERNNCKNMYGDDITKTEALYYEGEKICLRIANSVGKDKRFAVDQLEKEIHKWRKSYRYLKRLCRSSKTANEEETESCLVEYMLRDNYSETLLRLLQIKQEAMVGLHQAMIKIAVDLEECLEALLSNYLEKVRAVCYATKTGT